MGIISGNGDFNGEIDMIDLEFLSSSSPIKAKTMILLSSIKIGRVYPMLGAVCSVLRVTDTWQDSVPVLK